MQADILSFVMVSILLSVNAKLSFHHLIVDFLHLMILLTRIETRVCLAPTQHFSYLLQDNSFHLFPRMTVTLLPIQMLYNFRKLV